MLIFGYGSIINPDRINNFKLSYIVKNTDLIECSIYGFIREFNMYYYNQDTGVGNRYLGLRRKNGHETNGVVFELKTPKDVNNFCKDEGIGFPDNCYRLADISMYLTNYSFTEPVYACETINPDYTGKISSSYFKTLHNGLKFRTKKFGKEFLNSFGIIERLRIQIGF